MAQSLKDVQAVVRETFYGDVDIFRHGKAGKALSDAGGDFQRHLSELGREQSRKLGVAIKDIKYDHVICTPAPRGVHTALIAVSESRDVPVQKFVIAQGRALYAPNDDALFNETFRLVDVVGNMKYLDYKVADTMGCFEAFQAEALSAMLDAGAFSPDVRRVAVFNHAVMGSFIAEAILGAFRPLSDYDREKLNVECPECGCFRVTRDGDGAMVQFINYLA